MDAAYVHPFEMIRIFHLILFIGRSIVINKSLSFKKVKIGKCKRFRIDRYVDNRRV